MMEDGSNRAISGWLNKLASSAQHEKAYKVCSEAEVKQLKLLPKYFPNLRQTLELVVGAATLSAKTNSPFKFFFSKLSRKFSTISTLKQLFISIS
jgi:hypothetical protein